MTTIIMPSLMIKGSSILSNFLTAGLPIYHTQILLFKLMGQFFLLLIALLLGITAAFSHQNPTTTFVSAIWEDPHAASFSSPSLLHSQLHRLLYIRQFLAMQSPLIVYGQARILKLLQLQPTTHPNLIFIERDILSLKHLNDTHRERSDSDDKSYSLLQLLKPDYYKPAKLGLMDKLALLNDAKSRDAFRSHILVWLDPDAAYNFPTTMLHPINQFAKPFSYWQSPWLHFKQHRNATSWVRLDCFGGRKEVVSTVVSILENWHKHKVRSATESSQQRLMMEAVERYSYLMGTIDHFDLKDLRNFTYYSPKLHQFQQIRHFQISPNFLFTIQPDPAETIIVVKQQSSLTFSQQKATYLRIIERKGQLAFRRQLFAAAMVLLFIVNETAIQIGRKRWSSLADSLEEETTMIDN